MSIVTMIGLDLAKHSFQVHGVDEAGNKLFNRKLSRAQVSTFFAQQPLCTVVMEACSSSSYWARKIATYGHDVRRLHAKYVAQFRFRNKSDALDAMAICRAARQPDMPTVLTKSQEQCDMQSILRVRERYMQERTGCANQIRGLLSEDGIIMPKGICHVRTRLRGILSDPESELSGMKKELLQEQHSHLLYLDGRINTLTRRIEKIAKEREDSRRLMAIPGIGPVIALALVSVAGSGKDFKNSRAFSSYLGLVPREYSSGGKQRLLGISKCGNSYIRSLLVQGAHSALLSLRRKQGRYSDWASALCARCGIQKAAIGMANKMARIAWSMLAKGTTFDASFGLPNNSVAA